MSSSLGLLNRHIGAMFGHPKSLFIRTTPRSLLFEGIQFCVNTRGLAEVMCQILRDRQLNTMQVLSDKSVRFAMFKYVGVSVEYVEGCACELITTIAEERNQRWHVHGTLGCTGFPAGGRHQGLAEPVHAEHMANGTGHVQSNLRHGCRNVSAASQAGRLHTYIQCGYLPNGGDLLREADQLPRHCWSAVWHHRQLSERDRTRTSDTVFLHRQHDENTERTKRMPAQGGSGSDSVSR